MCLYNFAKKRPIEIENQGNVTASVRASVNLASFSRILAKTKLCMCDMESEQALRALI